MGRRIWLFRRSEWHSLPACSYAELISNVCRPTHIITRWTKPISIAYYGPARGGTCSISRDKAMEAKEQSKQWEIAFLFFFLKSCLPPLSTKTNKPQHNLIPESQWSGRATVTCSSALPLTLRNEHRLQAILKLLFVKLNRICGLFVECTSSIF